MSDSEPSFGLPKDWDKIPEEERKLLQKPLIFPNNERLFKRFTVGATLGEHVFKWSKGGRGEFISATMKYPLWIGVHILPPINRRVTLYLGGKEVALINRSCLDSEKQIATLQAHCPCNI
jgi:hypothetical protein